VKRGGLAKEHTLLSGEYLPECCGVVHDIRVIPVCCSSLRVIPDLRVMENLMHVCMLVLGSVSADLGI
jgi:hypothetical protein